MSYELFIWYNKLRRHDKCLKGIIILILCVSVSCSLRSPEPEMTLTTLIWPRKQVPTALHTMLNHSRIIFMYIHDLYTSTYDNSCYMFCSNQDKRRWPMLGFRILPLSRPVLAMSMVGFSQWVCECVDLRLRFHESYYKKITIFFVQDALCCPARVQGLPAKQLF